MTDHGHQTFRVDRRLKINMAVAIALVILCPLALWQFYFRYDRKGENEKPVTSELITNFCRSYNKPVFHSAEVFATQVENFLGSQNISPVDIDHTIAIDRQSYMYPRLTLIQNSVKDSANSKDQPIAKAWLREITYVKPVMQYRLREINVLFTFNEQGKILAYDTLGARGTVYSREMPK